MQNPKHASATLAVHAFQAKPLYFCMFHRVAVCRPTVVVVLRVSCSRMFRLYGL